MSQPSRISVVVPQPVLDDCMKYAQSIAEALKPYLTESLTAQERKELPKAGDKTEGFMQKIDDYIVSTPEFIPSFMDVQEFGKDYGVTADLKPLEGVISQIFSNISDTRLLAGSEAYVAALFYYANVRDAAKRGISNAKPVYEDLAKRYPGRGSKKKDGDS